MPPPDPNHLPAHSNSAFPEGKRGSAPDALAIRRLDGWRTLARGDRGARPLLAGLATVLLLAELLAPTTSAANLVTNGDFETLGPTQHDSHQQGLLPAPWFNPSPGQTPDLYTEIDDYGLLPWEFSHFGSGENAPDVVSDPNGLRWVGGGSLYFEHVRQLLEEPGLPEIHYTFSAEVHQGRGQPATWCLDLGNGTFDAPELACCLDPTTDGLYEWESRQCSFVAAQAFDRIQMRPLSVPEGLDAYPGIDDVTIRLTFCGNGTVDADENESCDDGNLINGDCCSDTCAPEPAGGGCVGDVDLCTPATCDGAGACVEGATRDCPADQMPFDCWTPACVPATGDCELTKRPGFSLCISDPDNIEYNRCTVEICTAQALCIVREHRDCSDTDACNGAETCQTTYNLGEPLPSVSCIEGIPPADGAACSSDGVGCTTDACTAGVCTHVVNDAACDDNFACTVESCDIAAGCSSTPVDAACDDGVACTKDTCSPTGGCLHEPIDTRCNDGIECTADACRPEDPAAGDDGCLSTPDNVVCDDGQGCTADICDATTGCLHEDPCDDGDLCSIDVCFEKPDENPDFRCENTLEPRPACFAASGSLAISENINPARNSLVWKWGPRAAPNVPRAALGNPASDAYALCIWDSTTAGGPTLWTWLELPPGLARPPLVAAGWTNRLLRAGADLRITYVDRLALSDGVGSVQIESSTLVAGRANAQVKAAGINLPLGAHSSPTRFLAAFPDVRAQLVNSMGTCWDTTFESGDISRNNASRFLAND